FQENAIQENQKNVLTPISQVIERPDALDSPRPSPHKQERTQLSHPATVHRSATNVFQIAKVSYRIESDKPADAAVHFQNEKGKTTHIEMTKLPFEYTYTKPFEQGEGISVRALNDTGATMTLSILVDDELVAARVYFGYEMVIGDLIHFFL
ncbi:MAG: hypothetical protein ACPGXL_10215, partial [Chitinophagales bacterium]